MRSGFIVSNFDLSAKRVALRDSYRNELTSEQTMRHRRLLNAGRLAQARALIEQAERFFLTAHEALWRMNECELMAFEHAMALDNAARLHQVVAAVLLRSEREVRHVQILSDVPHEERRAMARVCLKTGDERPSCAEPG